MVGDFLVLFHAEKLLDHRQHGAVEINFLA
jgi:hypothetical protein